MTRRSLALLALAVTSAAQAPCEGSLVPAPIPQGGSHFGAALAISAERLLVGQPLYVNASQVYEGRAHVFARVADDWILEETLVPPAVPFLPTGFAGTFFGEAVALDGDRAFVGLPGHSVDGVRCGAVFVYLNTGGTWGAPTVLLPSDLHSNGSFGTSLALDGDVLVVGSWMHAVGRRELGYTDGAAFVFRRVAGAWVEEARLSASDPQAQAHFGTSVSIEGERVLVAAPNADGGEGAAYVFERVGGTWTETAKLVNPAPATSFAFGHRGCVLDGGVAHVRAPGEGAGDPGYVAVYEQLGGAWLHVDTVVAPTGVRDFGAELVVEGEWMYARAEPLVQTGTEPDVVQVLRRTDSGWAAAGVLVAEGLSPADGFPFALALDGDRLQVGALRFGIGGGVFEFRRPGSTWTYGVGVAGSHGVPELVATGCAAPGEPFGLEVREGPAGAPGLLLHAPTAGAYPLLGGTLWLSPPWGGVLPYVLDGTGAAAFPVVLDASLAGQWFRAQAGHLDAVAPRGVALTPGLELGLR